MSAENKTGMGPDLNPQDEQMKKEAMFMSLFGAERGGFQSEVMRMKNPEKLSQAIDELSAVSVGLPCVRAVEKFSVYDPEKGEIIENRQYIVSTQELMQIFMSPDFMADKKGAGYYAETALAQSLLGSGRSEVVAGVVGPGKYTEEDSDTIVDGLVRSGKLDSSQAEAFKEQLGNALKPEAKEVLDVLMKKAARFRAQRSVWEAFRSHQMVSGDEKGAANIFVTAGHGAPQGPDWQEFYRDNGERDGALRQIYAAGLSYQELVAQGKQKYLIENVHYKKNKEGEIVPEKKNVYANGWTTEKFVSWIQAVLDKSNGNLMAAYDAWYSAIATGLVAKVAVNGVTVGDPPIVSSLDSWLIHFKEKQYNEAGLDENGNVKKLQLYKAKTGAIETIGKYPDSWIGSYFDTAKVGEDERSIFDLWWNDGTPIADIPWIRTDIMKEEEEVRLGSFDGWLYTKFQLFKMLDASQGVPPLKEISGYDYWDGMSRSLDKAFGVVYGLQADEKTNKIWEENVKKAREEGKAINERRKVKRDGVEFAQMVPDSLNPRMVLLKGILTRYFPGTETAKTKNDTPVNFDERFSTLSQMQKRKLVGLPGGKTEEASNPGAPIELFLCSYIESGMLTKSEAIDAVTEVYGKEVTKDILKNSPRLSNIK